MVMELIGISWTEFLLKLAPHTYENRKNFKDAGARDLFIEDNR